MDNHHDSRTCLYMIFGHPEIVRFPEIILSSCKTYQCLPMSCKVWLNWLKAGKKTTTVPHGLHPKKSKTITARAWTQHFCGLDFHWTNSWVVFKSSSRSHSCWSSPMNSRTCSQNCQQRCSFPAHGPRDVSPSFAKAGWKPWTTGTLNGKIYEHIMGINSNNGDGWDFF